MNHPSEEFETLRRLLALKRHEPPPPGYFDRFADRVIARLEAEGATRSPRWWQSCWDALTAPPAVALSYAALVLGMGALGWVLLQSLELESEGAIVAGPSWLLAGTPEAVSSPVTAAQGGFGRIDSTEPATGFSPVLGEGAPPFLFNPNGIRAQRVSYSSD